MHATSHFWRTSAAIAALGTLAFVLLAVRFSPNWFEFRTMVIEATAGVRTVEQRAVVEQAIFSGHSERGLHVIRQARDLKTEIENPIHKIVRWRLLMPALGHVLRLPDWLTLGLAHLGCLALTLALVGIGLGRSGPLGQPFEALWLAVIAGATAPFFSSMGWVGYYDSLLALALLGVAYARPRWVVAVACLAAPWIDERFVIGLPLALCIRWIVSDRGALSVPAWIKQQALLPLLLVAAYSIVRLKLGGSGGSQTVTAYLQEFVYSGRYPVGQRLIGAWAGLRLGWVLVACAVVGTWWATRTTARWPAWLLALGMVATGVVGLVTALDMSRSMVLLLPAVPLGWIFAVRTSWWKRYHAGPISAVLALGLPASHVIANASLPVDNLWSYSLPLTTAHNNLGMMYAMGQGVPEDGVKAARWLRRPAEEGVDIAQNNLGLLYVLGRGVKQDSGEAARWFRKAADQGMALAQENIGVLYANGDGVPKDPILAHAWFSLSLDGGLASAAERRAIVEQGMTPQEVARARELAQAWINEHRRKPAAKGHPGRSETKSH